MQCKGFSYFINKKQQCICNIQVRNFNELLANDIVNFEQLTPVFWGVCPFLWIFFRRSLLNLAIFYVFILTKFDYFMRIFQKVFGVLEILCILGCSVRPGIVWVWW